MKTQSNILHAAIVDSYNTRRATAFRNVLMARGCLATIVFYTEGEWRFGDDDRDAVGFNEPRHYDLCLWHITDSVREVRPSVLAPRNVYYGGNAWPDERLIPALLEYQINRPILSADDSLTANELDALFAFLVDSTTVRPEFLGEPRSQIALTSLAILCQGFLLAHSRDNAACKTLLKVSDDDFKQLLPKLPQRAMSEEEKTIFWRFTTERCEKLSDMVASECRQKGLVVPIMALVTQMSSARTIDLSVVMSAYRAIKEEIAQ